MPHPLVIVHGSEWIKILHYIKQTIALFALSEGNSEEDVAKLIEQYVNEIEENRQDIFLQTAVGIVEYLNFYKVFPTEGVHDEFKGIYFTGVAVSRHLVRLGLADLNKFHLKALLRLLDFRLEEPHKIRRPRLTERVLSVIDNNAMDAHLGKYGWYLIYKCLYNSVNEKSKTI
jgi:hypothetical protein